ncbi:MAG: O-antigen ligase family protein, partial [Thermodesulfobacteriota bacterium]
LAVCLIRRPDAASGLAVLHEFKMVVFMAVVVSAVRTPGELKLLLYSICAAVLLQVVMVNVAALTGSAIKVSAKLSGELMSFSGARASYLRATGTVGHVNQEAAFLTFFGIPLVALMMAGGRFWKIVGLVSVVGTFVAIGLTFSRGAWLSLAVGMAAILVVAVKKRDLVFRHWVYGLPVLLAAAVLLPMAGKPALDRMFYGDEGATASRKRAMLLARDLFAFHPLAGVGAGNFSRAALDYFPPEKKKVNWVRREETAKFNWQVSSRLEMTQVTVNGRQYDIPLPVHNKYMLVMAELGAVGLLLFLWFQIRTWGHIRRGLQSGMASGRWLAIGLAGAFFASQCYMNLDLFADDKTMQILLIIPVLAMINDRIASFAWEDRA